MKKALTQNERPVTRILEVGVSADLTDEEVAAIQKRLYQYAVDLEFEAFQARYGGGQR